MATVNLSDTIKALRQLSRMGLDTLATDLDNAASTVSHLAEVKALLERVKADVAAEQTRLAGLKAETAKEAGILAQLRTQQGATREQTNLLKSHLSDLKGRIGSLLGG